MAPGRNFFILLTVSSFLLLFSSCKKDIIAGTGASITETRDIKNFYSVTTYDDLKVSINCGTQYKVVVGGYENLVAQLRTRIQNGALVIKFDENAVIQNNNIQVVVTMPTITGVIANDNSNIQVNGPFVSLDAFSANIFGGGTIGLNVGSVKNFKSILSGNGTLSASAFQAENAIVEINGNGKSEVNVSKTLNATINGNGKIYYKGDPVITSQINGSGQLIKL